MLFSPKKCQFISVTNPLQYETVRRQRAISANVDIHTPICMKWRNEVGVCENALYAKTCRYREIKKNQTSNSVHARFVILVVHECFRNKTFYADTKSAIPCTRIPYVDRGQTTIQTARRQHVHKTLCRDYR